MRIFIAIEVPEDISSSIRNIQDNLKTDTIKATYPKEFHLTLHFIGEIDEVELENIKSSLNSIEFESFKIILDKIGVFPNKDYIRVVWLGIKETEKIESLAQGVKKVFDTENSKQFHPHITLARIKHVNDKEKFNQMLKNINISPLEFPVKSVKLIKSILHKDGPVYNVLMQINAKNN